MARLPRLRTLVFGLVILITTVALYILRNNKDEVEWIGFNSTVNDIGISGPIAILIPSTTRSIKNPSLKSLSLTTVCIPSIKYTAEAKFLYRVYVGTESDDYLVTQFDALRAMSSANVQIVPVKTKGGYFTKVTNYIARQAFKDGAVYFVRINDDTRMVTKNWASLAVDTLRSFSPRNVGVVGPTCKQGNTILLSHDMVHETHLLMFKYYYPPILQNWYIDDWITAVYMPNRTIKLPSWEVKHTMDQGTRYNIDKYPKKWLMSLIILGRVTLHTMIKKESFRPTLQVISYSLFGSDSRYTDGAIANAKLASQIYPGWVVRVYHDDTVPRGILETLQAYKVQLVNMSSYSPVKNRTLWRLFIALDHSVQRYIIRNTDSRLTWREKAAVDQWIESGKHFHIMRDHPFHSEYTIPSGLWGAMHGAVPDIITLIDKYIRTKINYVSLQKDINEEIWKLANASVIQHDAFSCETYHGSLPFPTQRKKWEYVGNKYVDGKIQEEEVEVLIKAKQPAKCTK